MANRIRRRARGRAGIAGVRRATTARPFRLGVLAIMKNEAHLIDEWLQHYLSFGADRIYLIDNGGTDDTLAKVEPWLQDGRVALMQLTEPHKQREHYWTAFQHFKIAEQCDWRAIADIDEFLFCKSGESLADYLDRQTGFDAIYTNWTNFGSSGLDVQPESVRSSLVQCNLSLDRFAKFIFRTWVPGQMDDIEVHCIRNVPLRRTRIANRDLQMNHYVTQSRSYWFAVKMKRGDVFYQGQDLNHLAARFDLINAACTDTCTRLRDLVARQRPKA
jgi:hypothetical protein